MIVEQTKNSWTGTVLLTLFADGLALLAALFWLPMLAEQLTKPSGWNALLLVIFYILFCIGVYFIRKLQPENGASGWQPPNFLLDTRVRGVLAFLFGLLMMTTLAYQLGYFASIQSIRSAGLDEGDSSALFVFMPGALLGFSMLYILVLAFPVVESVSPGSRGSAILSALGLVLINGMVLFCAAQAKAFVGEMGAASDIINWMAVLLILIVSFAPPRAVFQSKYPYRSSILSFGLLLLILSWLVVS